MDIIIFIAIGAGFIWMIYLMLRKKPETPSSHQSNKHGHRCYVEGLSDAERRVVDTLLRAEGDSMNLAGVQDGDLVLCRQQLKADTGDKVVSLLGDNVTIKIYGERINGVRKLLPKSTNKTHKPITPGEGDSVQGVVQEILEKELN